MCKKFKYAGLWCFDIGRVSILLTEWENGWHVYLGGDCFGKVIDMGRIIVHIRNKGIKPQKWL